MSFDPLLLTYPLPALMLLPISSLRVGALLLGQLAPDQRVKWMMMEKVSLHLPGHLEEAAADISNEASALSFVFVWIC